MNILLLANLAFSALSCQSSGGDSGSGGTTTTDTPPAETPKADRLPPASFKASLSTDGLTSVSSGIRCQGDTKSPNGDGLTYRTRWYIVPTDVNGVPSTDPQTYKEISRSSAELTVTPSESHTTITCRIEAIDTSGNVTASSYSEPLAVVNALPAAFIPTLSRTSFFSAETMECEAATVDPDGDTLTYEYTWQRLSLNFLGVSVYSDIAGASAKTYTVPAAMIGEDIRCLVDVRDGHGGVLTIGSKTANIRNRQPAGFLATLSTYAPRVGDSVLCSGDSSDPDGGALVSKDFRWVFSGSETGPYEQLSTAYTSPSLVVPQEAAHKYLRCEITVADVNGGQTVSLQAASGFVVNVGPSAFSANVAISEAAVGQSLSCQAGALDADGDALSYVFEWVSSCAGQSYISAGLPFQTIVVPASLSRCSLKCRATASDNYLGQRVSADSTAVSIRNTSPAPFAASVSATTQKFGDTFSCVGQTTDADQNTLSYSYKWQSAIFEVGPFFDLAASSRDLAITSTLAHKYLRCQVTADDGYTGVTISDYSAAKAVLNTPPADFAASLSDQTYHVGDNLSCQAGTTDSDLDTLSLTYEWQADDSGGSYVTIAGESGASFLVGQTQAHRNIRCRAVADDSYGGVTVSSYSPGRYIANTLPAAFSASLPAQPVRVGDTVSCEGSTSDLDGDALSYSYDWKYSQSESGPYVLPAGTQRQLSITPAITRGFLVCSVTASDGTGSTLSATSATLAVVNTQPAAFTTDTVSTSPILGGTVDCLGSTTDADEDSISYSYEWLMSDTSGGGRQSIAGASTSQLAIATAQAHKYIYCQIVASDSNGGVTTSTIGAVTYVTNTYPEPFTATVSYLAIKLGETTSCLGDSSDVDQDTLSPSYQWYVSSSASGPFTEIPSGLDRDFVPGASVAHQYVKCKKTLADGYGGSVSSETPVVTILNTDPAAFTAGLSPTSGVIGTTLTCSGSTFDVDGDTVTTDGYTWEKSSGSGPFSAIVGQSTSTVTLDASLAHTTIRCRITVSDGHGGQTVSAVSGLSTYTNTKPEDFLSTVDVTSAKVGDVVTCGGATTDVDTDPLTYTTNWYVADTFGGPYTPIAGAASLSYTVQSAVAHKFIKCERAVDDGYGGLTAASASGVVTLLDSNPTLATIAAKTVAEAATLSFSVTGFSDIDLDEAQYTCLSGCPSEATLDSKTGAFSYTPGYGEASLSTPTKTYNPILRVFDGKWSGATFSPYGGYVDSSLSIQVTNTDRGPTITATCPGTAQAENSTFYVTYSATDPDGDPVAVTLTSIGGTSIGDDITLTQESANARYAYAGTQDSVAHTGTFTGTTVKSYYRDITVNLKATSGAGLQSTTSCSAMLNDVDRAPTLTLTCPGTQNETTLFYIPYVASDLDGDIVTTTLGTYTGAQSGDNIAFSNDSGNSRVAFATYGYGAVSHTPPVTGSQYYRNMDVPVSAASNGLSGQSICSFVLNDATRPATAGNVTNSYGIGTLCDDASYGTNVSNPDGASYSVSWSGHGTCSRGSFNYRDFQHTTLLTVSNGNFGNVFNNYGDSIYTDGPMDFYNSTLGRWYAVTSNGQTTYAKSTVSGCALRVTAAGAGFITYFTSNNQFAGTHYFNEGTNQFIYYGSGPHPSHPFEGGADVSSNIRVCSGVDGIDSY